jgi:CRP-like cAMP-binding protein
LNPDEEKLLIFLKRNFEKGFNKKEIVLIMFDMLQTHIMKKVQLSDEEFSLATTFFIPKKVRKRQFLLQEGDDCKWLIFVSKGCLRCYSVDSKGEEHIIRFAVEGWWISDIQSFLTGKPATNYIDAIEDSELLMIEKTSYDNLCTIIPKLEHYFRILLENSNSAALMRISDLISASAEERYLNFLNSYPEIVQRVPQSQIASYLGITPQSLSRIRKELSEKK